METSLQSGLRRTKRQALFAEFKGKNHKKREKDKIENDQVEGVLAEKSETDV